MAIQAWKRCETLAMYSESSDCLTRTFLSTPMKQVHASVREWMDSAGLEVRMDGIGNIIGHRPPPTPDAPVYAIGSHLDTVPDGGIYDGALGVTAGIAVAKLLKEEELPFGLEVVGFVEEEGIRFSFPFLGSHAYAGSFEPEMLYLKDQHGQTVEEVCKEYGLNPRDLIHTRSAPENLAGYFELHIEQGFALEKVKKSVGYVKTIAGQQRLKCRVKGKAQHAGSTPMDMRHDALQAACRMIELTEKVSNYFGDLVMTTGYIQAWPNAANSIPGELTFSIDTRHHNDMLLDQAVTGWIKQASQIAEKRNVSFEVIGHQYQSPVNLNKEINQHIESTMKKANVEMIPLISWAGHDVLVMADVCPCSMIMLRTRDGLSHHPDEFTSVEDTMFGVYTLYETIKNLKNVMK